MLVDERHARRVVLGDEAEQATSAGDIAQRQGSREGPSRGGLGVADGCAGNVASALEMQSGNAAVSNENSCGVDRETSRSEGKDV